MEPTPPETADDLDQRLRERLQRVLRRPSPLVRGLRRAAALVVRGWLRGYHRLSVEGRENLPAEGSFVMVANHASHLDALCLLSALPLGKLDRAFPAAAEDYFFVSLPRLAVAAIVANALPFNRRAKIRQSLSMCRRLLEEPGNVLILFPEGTRSTTGEVGEFRPGIGLVLAGSPVPVVPCWVEGAYEAWPKGKLFPRPRRVRLVIGRPICYRDLEQGKGAAREVSRHLREAVVSLAPRREAHPKPACPAPAGIGRNGAPASESQRPQKAP